MSEKEYIVTPNKGVDYAIIPIEMIAQQVEEIFQIGLLTLQTQDRNHKEYTLRTNGC